MLRLALVSVLALALPASARAGSSARCEGEFAQERIERIDSFGDLVDGTGRLLKLADIRLFEGARERLSAFAGEIIAVRFAGGADRWGRIPARIVLTRGGRDLATLLVSEGLALADAGEGEGLCLPGLLAEEDGARRTGRGVWASGPLAASEPESIARRAGQFVVVEGRIVGVGERARWTYLNFGRDFSKDFAVSISRRNWEAMKRGGLSAAALTGRHVRVRGIVEIRRAPGMEITSMDMIERSDGPAPSAR